MRQTLYLVTAVLLVVLLTVHSVAAQATSPDIWRSFVERVDVGTELNVRRTMAVAFEPRSSPCAAMRCWCSRRRASQYSRRSRASRSCAWNGQAGRRRSEGRRDRRRHRRGRKLRDPCAALRGGRRLNAGDSPADTCEFDAALTQE